MKPFNPDELAAVTIFLGANDCALPESPQHVPIDEFKQNIIVMVNKLESHKIPKNKVVLITPPIYFQSRFAEYRRSQGDEVPPLRANEQPKLYAHALNEVGKELGVSVVDTYSAFEADGRGEALFNDGLHFSPIGAELMYNLVVNEIESRVLSTRGQVELVMNYPPWAEINSDTFEQSLKNK